MAKLLPVCAAITAISTLAAAQDTCSTANASTIGSGIYLYDSSGFTIAGPINPCRGSADPFDYWFLYTATASGVATVSNCRASIMAPGGAPLIGQNTAVVAWDSSVCPPTTRIACSDSAPNCPGANESEVVFSVIAGQSYYVQVTNGPASNVPISGFIAIVEMPPIPGDDCGSALPGTVGVISTSNIGATTTPGVGAACTLGSATNEIWYTIVPTCSSSMQVTTCGMTGTLSDTFIAVYDACPTLGGNETACDDNNDSGGPCVGSARSSVTVSTIPGNTYYIAVGGRNGGQGTFDLTIRCKLQHQWSQPGGPGSLRFETLNGVPGALVFSAITLDILHPGLPANMTFPNGWFYGLPMLFADVVAQLLTPPPSVFTSFVDSAGYSENLNLPAGSVSGLIGVTLWSVGLEFDPATGFALVSRVTDPTAYLITS